MELVGHLMVVSLYLIGQVLTLLQTCCSQCVDPKTLITNNHANYSAPSFKLLNNSNLTLCMIVCNKFKLCLSVYWIQETKTCRLNTRSTIKNDNGLMTEGHYIHVKRENFPEHVAGDCLNHTCTEDSICIPGNCSAVFKGFKDCSEILSTDSSRKGQDGVYVIYIDDTWREVFCDMTTDGGGWTIIQKREDGDVDFYRTWKEYKEGFGNASKNYWIGNQAIHALTKDKNQELRIDFQRHNGEQASAVYTTFYIGDEDSKYTLTVSGYNGTAGDSLSWHNGMRFSTKDQENDIDSSRNCATTFHGAWWYRYCFQSNLNREYAQSAANDPRYATRWHFKRSHEALQKTVMMIRQN